MSRVSQVATVVADADSVDAAIESRFSCRAFVREREVPRETIEEILDVAARAPSGTNTQPWRVYVLQGAQRDALADKVCAAHDAVYFNPALAVEYREEYDYYPTQWVSPYIDRRRENGWGLYGLLGIAKGEKDKMHAQHQRNFRFFDAPVGLMFTMDRILGRGSLMDYGMFLQNIMVAARARPAHVPAGGVERLREDHPAAHWGGAGGDAGVRDVLGLCGRGSTGEQLPHAAGAGFGVYALGGLSWGSPSGSPPAYGCHRPRMARARSAEHRTLAVSARSAEP